MHISISSCIDLRYALFYKSIRFLLITNMLLFILSPIYSRTCFFYLRCILINTIPLEKFAILPSYL